MKRICLLLMTVCSLYSPCRAQSYCHTHSTSANCLENIDIQDTRSQNTYHIRVFFHIIQNYSGTGVYSFPESSIPQCMQTLYDDFSDYNLFFDYTGLDTIYSDVFYNITDLGNSNYAQSIYTQLIYSHSHSDAIDIYLLPTHTNIGGRANDVPGRALAIGGNMNGTILGSSHVLSHEMGHCLGLFHTFHGGSYEPEGCRELVNGSNCTTCGDFVCDTPADPFPLFDSINSLCVWNNTSVKDANGQLYNPDTKQIMAYITPSCMEHFSWGQSERMKAHIQTQPILQARVTPNVICIQNTTYNNGETKYEYATDSIFAGYNVTTGTNGNVIVKNGANVTYQSNDVIVLRPGFIVETGAIFEAKIGTNNTTNRNRRYDISGMNYIPLSECNSWTTIQYGFEPPTIAQFYDKVGTQNIDNKKYIVIKNISMNVDEKKILEETERIYYLYEDYAQRKVYLYNKEEKKDQLIYDFTLNIADKLPMSPEFELKEISEIFNLDQKRKQYIFVNEHNDSIVWIEGIGNYTDLVNSIALKRPYYKRVLCVKKNEKTIYETEKFHGYNCTDIEEKRGYAGIELPNNIGIISIKDNNLIAFAGVTGVVLISIFDYSGQCVLQTRDTTIDVSRLPEGIYILQAVTADGQVLQDKFIRTK